MAAGPGSSLINPLNKLIDELARNVHRPEVERIQCLLDNSVLSTDSAGKQPYVTLGYYSFSGDNSVYTDCKDQLMNLKKIYPENVLDIFAEIFTTLDTENGRKNLTIIENYRAQHADVSTHSGHSLPPPYDEGVVQTHPKEVAGDSYEPHVSLPPYFEDDEQTRVKEMDVDSTAGPTNTGFERHPNSADGMLGPSTEQQPNSDELKLDL